MGKELQKASAASLALENRLSTIEARIGFNEYAKDKNLANERVSAFQNRVLLSNKNSDKIAKKYKLEKNSDQVLKPAGKAKASKEKNEEIKFLANVSRYSRYTASYELLGSAKQTKEVKNETINKVNAPAPSLIYANMNETNLVAQSATEIIVSNKVDTKKIRDQGKVEILSAMTGKTSDEKMYTRKNETKKPASVVVSDSKKLSLVEQFNLKCNSNLLDNKSPIDIMTELMSKSSDTEMNKLACSEMPKSILPTNITNNPCDNIIQDSVDYSDINTCKTDNYMETKKQELEWFATETDNHRMDYVSGTASSPDLIGRMTNLMNIAKMCAANKQAIGDANANKHKYPFNHADIAVEMLKLQCIEIYKTTIPAENCAGDSHTTHWLLNKCLENIDNDLSWNRNRVDGYFRFPNDIRKLIDKIVGKKEYLVCNKFNAIFDPTNQGISPSLKLTNEQQKVYDYILQNKKNMNIKKPIKIEKQGCESMKYLIDRLHSPIAPIKHDKETLKLLKYRITKAKDYLASTKICKESKKTKICSYDPIGLESNLRGRQEILDALKSKTSR